MISKTALKSFRFFTLIKGIKIPNLFKYTNEYIFIKICFKNGHTNWKVHL